MLKKALLIDHDDSFIWNIKAWLSPHFDVQIINHQKQSLILDLINQPTFDLIVLSPGPKSPSDYPFSLQLLKNLPSEKPVLGICLGFQMMAEHFGQKSKLAPKALHGKTSHLKISYHFQNHPYWSSFENAVVARYHSLVTQNSNELNNLATSKEDASIMWSYAVNKKWMGFQFHPESFLTEFSAEFLKAVSYWMKKDSP